MVEPLCQERAKGVLAGMPAGPVTAVVAEGDRFGQCDVQPAGACDATGDLGHLQGVGQPGALVVGGKDEDLSLPSQPAEWSGMEDSVSIPLEAGSPSIGFLGSLSIPGPDRPGSADG